MVLHVVLFASKEVCFTTVLFSEDDTIIDLQLDWRVLGNFICLRLAQHPLTREIESCLAQLVKRCLTMGELTLDAPRCEIMEQAGVKDANSDTIDAYVASQQDIPGVVHDTEATLAHRVATVL